MLCIGRREDMPAIKKKSTTAKSKKAAIRSSSAKPGRKKATVKKVASKKAKMVKLPTKKTKQTKKAAPAVKNKIKKVAKIAKKTKITRPKTTGVKKTITPMKTKKMITKKTKKETILPTQAFTAENKSHTVFPEIIPYEIRPNEEYMNEGQLAHFARILLARKQALMEEVDRTVSHMKDEAANFPDPNDRASQEEEFSLELRARDRERKLIKKIEETLERIKARDYGYCDACGIEIGIRRLEARPTATLCIDCKTLDEIKERQVGG